MPCRCGFFFYLFLENNEEDYMSDQNNKYSEQIKNKQKEVEKTEEQIQFEYLEYLKKQKVEDNKVLKEIEERTTKVYKDKHKMSEVLLKELEEEEKRIKSLQQERKKTRGNPSKTIALNAAIETSKKKISLLEQSKSGSKMDLKEDSSIKKDEETLQKFLKLNENLEKGHKLERDQRRIQIRKEKYKSKKITPKSSDPEKQDLRMWVVYPLDYNNPYNVHYCLMEGN
jgi:hypothetical protein